MRLLFLDLIDWDYDIATPFERPLGGSQSALCYLTVALAKRGHDVTLVTSTSRPRRIDGVNCLSTRDPPRGMQAEPWDALVVLNGPAEIAVPFGAHLHPATPLVLWTQHADDQPAMRALERAETRNRWDAIVCVSQWHRQSMIDRFRLDPSRVFVLPNAIGPAFDGLFADRQELMQAKAGHPILAYTSTPFRGLEVLLNLWPEARRDCPDAELRIYSSMKVYQQDEAADPHRALYQLSRKTAGVSYIGSLPQPRLAQELKSASVLAYPNTFAETSCIAVMEALAAGLLVLTVDRGALAESTMGFGVLIPQDAALGATFLAKLKEVLHQRSTNLEAFASARFDRVQAANRSYTWSVRAVAWEEAIAGWKRKHS